MPVSGWVEMRESELQNTIEAEDGARTVGLGTFLLVAVAWLAFSFAIWFFLSSFIVFPVIRGTSFVLLNWMPEVFEAVSQSHHRVVIGLLAQTHGLGGLPEGAMSVDVYLDALKFCYGLPIYVGLTAATALWSDRYWPKIVLGFVVLPFTQIVAMVGEALKIALFDVSAATQQGLIEAGIDAAASAAIGQQAARDTAAQLALHWITPEVAALWSQFGSLIVPVLAPVALWIAVNGHFLRALQGSAWRQEEPNDPLTGRNEPAKESDHV